jgi:hypothetical protein
MVKVLVSCWRKSNFSIRFFTFLDFLFLKTRFKQKKYFRESRADLRPIFCHVCVFPTHNMTKSTTFNTWFSIKTSLKLFSWENKFDASFFPKFCKALPQHSLVYLVFVFSLVCRLVSVFYLPHMEYEGSIGLVTRKMKFFYC